MDISELVTTPLNHACDLIFAIIPQKNPPEKNLRNCKIISHRGQYDNLKVFENTLTAFDNALNNNGVWGIEFDFRWTKDIQPVVIHDPDLKRLFDSKIKISETTLSDLKQNFPEIPSLKEVVARYGGKLHLMVEAKEEHNSQAEKQNKILKDIFDPLKPSKDYHILSLSSRILDSINFVENTSKIIVAIFNEHSQSKTSIIKKYAGIGGHYLLIKNLIVRKHLKLGQKIGTGYPKSKNSLFREINRGVEWIFCNEPEKLCKIIQKELQKNNSNKL